MATCRACGLEGPLVSNAIGACLDCLRAGKREALEEAGLRRAGRRQGFDLPAAPPRTAGGALCRACANACRLASGEAGWCGARTGRSQSVVPLAGEAALVDWYLDPLPTNCVAAECCAASGAGHPLYTHRDGPEHGFHNLAVFYNGCSFDCAFCQNWHHRHLAAGPRTATALAQAAREESVSCICYFGGDPTPHFEHALAAAHEAVDARKAEILRVCWETNGMMSRKVLGRVIEVSLRTGGTVKFDLKAWSEPLHRALTGCSNRQTLGNFRVLAGAAHHRPDPPLAAASTLLVPGYVDAREVGSIARFIAGLDPSTPYSLLAFHPDFAMRDLPVTTRAQASECLEAARNEGLERVRVGNMHLL